jgi:tetratricopeptide (TPR) repeat protein
MRQGNSTDAELEFKQLTAGYPQLTGAHINLALIQRKTNRLDEAEGTLKSAVEKNPASAMAWTELGLTQRMRGEFQDAVVSYEKAIAADANYAPAHRNLAVLLDLYLGDPERALTELERYKELTGEEKPVTSWIAELRQRTGKPAAPRPNAAPAQPAPSEGAPAESPASSDAPTAPSPPKPVESPQPRAGATIAQVGRSSQSSRARAFHWSPQSSSRVIAVGWSPQASLPTLIAAACSSQSSSLMLTAAARSSQSRTSTGKGA